LRPTQYIYIYSALHNGCRARIQIFAFGDLCRVAEKRLEAVQARARCGSIATFNIER
jgi:hypothetical protein